jgi:K+-sensing histidine kinase KdpD
MMRGNDLTPPWAKYAAACLLGGLAIAITSALPWAVPKPGVLLMNLLAVMIAAYLGGFGPGLLATALSALGAIWFLLPPVHSLHIQSRSDVVFLGIFTSAACAATWLLDWSKGAPDS